MSLQNQKHFLCPGHKICVRKKCCARANGETFVSATMCSQQCVLVCQGLKLDLLWVYITTLSDWLKNLPPLSCPIRSKNRLGFLASRFDWFAGFSVTLVIGQSKARHKSTKHLSGHSTILPN